MLDADSRSQTDISSDEMAKRQVWAPNKELIFTSYRNLSVCVYTLTWDTSPFFLYTRKNNLNQKLGARMTI